MNKYNNKFEPGDIVYYIELHNRKYEDNVLDYCKISIERVESVDINISHEYHYWLSGEDGEIDEECLVSIDDAETLTKLINDNLNLKSDIG